MHLALWKKQTGAGLHADPVSVLIRSPLKQSRALLPWCGTCTWPRVARSTSTAICDTSLRILSVEARHEASTKDSFIWVF
ncbi:hypothetical protein HHUSO_G23799 [Huso huso]|uniref:Uncharacterized protein n=1 Tax=Huso huso TaxID=61971 RepID=A0ABR0YTG1_HUSHU